MSRWQWHVSFITMFAAPALWAGCAKKAVDYQTTGAGVSTRPPVAVAPAPPEPAEAGPTSPQGAGTGAEAAPTPAAPLVGAQRPSPAEYSASDALKDIYFDFDKHAIRPDAATTLTANAAWLKTHPGTAVMIEGHCDGRGTVEYNLALGQRRAQAAREFLLAQGVPGGRLATISYGKEKLACTDSSEECMARNRRAHFLVKPS
jgi:peptidoglycan-associated lipoprotein